MMGLFDFLKTDDHKKDAIATEINLYCGVLEQCYICGDVVDKQRNDKLPQAITEAKAAFSRNDPKLGVFVGNREDLIRRLDTAREPLPYACSCEDN